MTDAPEDPIQRIEREELARGHIGPGETPVEPRPAATVALARGDADALELLLLRRPERSRFAAGAWVFPGGTIDPGDGAPALLARLGPAHAAREGPALAAGLRELFEETGILPADRLPAAAARRRAREALLADRVDFAAVAERLDLTFHRLEVAYFARWITPEKLTRRYDTRFFLARDRDGRPELTEEHTEARWMAPRDAVAGFREGRLPMLFPTWKTLEALARFEGLEAALEALAAREVRPIRAGLEVRGDRVVPTMTPDPLYDGPEGGDEAR